MLKSGEKGLIGPGSNDYGRNEKPFHAHKVIKNELSGMTEDLLALNRRKKMKRNNSGIYKILNIVNKKVYVGSTADFTFREQEHFYRLEKRFHHNVKLQNAFNKYGRQNFVFEIIEECSEIQLIERELFWTEKLDSIDNGYNLVLPGQSSINILIPVVQLSMQGEVLKTFLSIKDATSEIMGYENKYRDDIGACLRGKQKSAFGFMWMHYNIETFKQDLKQVLENYSSDLIEQIDLYTGERIEIFNNKKQAEVVLDKKPGNSTINHCLTGKYTEAHGYWWRRFQPVEKRKAIYYAAMDVGKSGAVSILKEDGSQVFAFKFPLLGKEFDTNRLKNYLSSWTGYIKACVIEDVHSIFGVSAKANFEFGRNAGILEGIACALNIPIVKVAPKTWQAVCFEGVPVMVKPGKTAKGRGSIDTKAMSAIAVKRLYPKAKLQKSDRAIKDDTGICDSILMCHYAKIKNL